ncbi:MAG: hypothetical protein ACR2NR_03025 [Solirubrobacteraceae bacterium]
MLASITPLGERGRNNHWAITLTAFAAAATVAGAALGALLGAFGGLVLPSSFAGHARLVLAGLLVLIAVAIDLGADRRGAVPGPRRQVDERWLDRYRGWVYGLGYGAQLGLGVTTFITSAATYVALACALLGVRAAAGAVIAGVYGALRGLTPLLAAAVHTPPQLLALHARLDRVRPPVARAGAALLGTGALVALVTGLS